MKILVTAFDPFGGESINPALEAVKLMKDKIAGAEIVKLEIPTVFGKSIEITVEAIRKENPDAVLCVGQAGGRFEVTPERVAINVDDARIPDNEGNQPIDEPVYEDGGLDLSMYRLRQNRWWEGQHLLHLCRLLTSQEHWKQLYPPL